MRVRLHRFYVDPAKTPLVHDLWVHDMSLVHQWRRVLRYKVGQELVLFDGVAKEVLYKLVSFADDGVQLQYVTDFVRKLPQREVYLFWALLKKDKNDWVIQKGTELGVNHFVPILSERCEKTGFVLDRAQKIAIEAAEQCGRSNIPTIREPLQLATAIDEFKGKMPLYVCQQSTQATPPVTASKVGLYIGPEGGWSEDELELFARSDSQSIAVADFTLRAETAAVAAITRITA